MNSILKNKKIIALIIISIAIIIGTWFLSSQKEENNIKEKEFYSRQYDASSIEAVERITPEMTEQYKEKFTEYQNKLEEAIKKYEEGGRKEEEKPDPDYFIEKARYANYLGQTDWAIEILNSVFNYYDNSSVAWNNLAKIYESKKDYEKANEYYQKIIDTFGEKQFYGQYYYIAKNYMLSGNKEKTKEAYEKYEKHGGKDSEIEEYLAE